MSQCHNDTVSPLSDCSLGSVWSGLISQIYPVTGSCQCSDEVTLTAQILIMSVREAEEYSVLSLVYLSIDNRIIHQRSYCSCIFFCLKLNYKFIISLSFVIAKKMCCQQQSKKKILSCLVENSIQHFLLSTLKSEDYIKYTIHHY